MTLKYLITGATGGLGSQVLAYFVANVPATEYAATSSNEENRKHFEDRGIAFRLVKYEDAQSMEAAFADVENLLFVSTNTFDVEKRRQQHQNFVDAATKMKVKHVRPRSIPQQVVLIGLMSVCQVWYTSLAFGGFGPDSKADVMRCHLLTEEMLRRSDVNFTSIREGLYTDAFPVFMGWYPSTSTVYLTADGPVAFTLREELGEATARLMIRGGHDREIVLLTAQKSITFSEVVDLINETTGRQVQLKLVSPDEFVAIKAAEDEGGKAEGFFRKIITWYDSIAKGEGAITDPLMADLLGREPVPPRAAIATMLKENRDYGWHQNYAKRG
ncbi:uncharacterized protein N7459_003357 [Penicillium hispanicum]|uniref:uncharacterized protein n=1 Tax=Penicillium hispanicum TaxID=1080232 RepID=UPI002540A038|nr:uncharacterized protein N7459_003357 [Penicillium hispanicum]KAJ5587592.1 hypothetical protein N7459_003357 [Penicillium hispanicum]